jgi:hypothetical protein
MQVCQFNTQGWQRSLWEKGRFVGIVGLNEASVNKYIRERENADRIIDKVSMKGLEGHVQYERDPTLSGAAGKMPL